MSKRMAVWIDRKEAHIFHIHPDRADEELVSAPQHLHHRHPKGHDGGKEHPDDAKRFFHEVTRSLEGSEELLLVGPSTAKLELLRYLEKHEQPHGPKVVGIETVDHPTNGQLVAHARAYFERVERRG
jgi:stalled ribosome rescue protein Dom34